MADPRTPDPGTSASDAPRIRVAGVADVAAIRAIARAAYAKYVPRIGREPAPMTEDYAAAVAMRHAVVAEVAGRVCGYMVAWPEGGAYFIESLGVDPQSQGHGLGRRLIEHAVAAARRGGLPALRLYTNEAMAENLAMYAHFGFAETHRVTEAGFRRVYMRWVLPDG